MSGFAPLGVDPLGSVLVTGVIMAPPPIPIMAAGLLWRKRRLEELAALEEAKAKHDADVYDLVENRGFPEEVLLLLMLH